MIAQRLISLANIKEQLQAQINEYSNYLPMDYLMIFKNLTEDVKLEDERLINLLNLINLRSSFESSILGEEKIEEEFQELLRQLRLEYLKEKKEELYRLLKEAEENNDETKATFVLKEFNEVLRQAPSPLEDSNA